MEIYLVCPPGLERSLLSEVQEKGFKHKSIETGGITLKGDWSDVWRANLVLRGASRVLVRIGGFRAVHLAQLDKRARKFPWQDFLRPDVSVRLEATCRKSKIYHQKAAIERIARALSEAAGIPVAEEGEITLKIRIFEDFCTFSLDTSGELLHKRGAKAALNKAPMRETLCALLLRECGFQGTEPVVDPMCGSGSFVLEAGEIALGLAAGRNRDFAFEQFAGFDPDEWEKVRSSQPMGKTDTLFYGFDRDKGAIDRCHENAKRGDLETVCRFSSQPISALVPPVEQPGLVMINPPYGKRIGDVKKLTPLYQSLGKVLRERFKGWRVGLVCNNENLARVTGLPFIKSSLPFNHGGISVKLYKTDELD